MFLKRGVRRLIKTIRFRGIIVIIIGVKRLIIIRIRRVIRVVQHSLNNRGRWLSWTVSGYIIKGATMETQSFVFCLLLYRGF